MKNFTIPTIKITDISQETIYLPINNSAYAKSKFQMPKFNHLNTKPYKELTEEFNWNWANCVKIQYSIVSNNYSKENGIIVSDLNNIDNIKTTFLEEFNSNYWLNLETSTQFSKVSFPYKLPLKCKILASDKAYQLHFNNSNEDGTINYYNTFNNDDTLLATYNGSYYSYLETIFQNDILEYTLNYYPDKDIYYSEIKNNMRIFGFKDGSFIRIVPAVLTNEVSYNCSGCSKPFIAPISSYVYCPSDLSYLKYPFEKDTKMQQVGTYTRNYMNIKSVLLNPVINTQQGIYTNQNKTIVTVEKADLSNKEHWFTNTSSYNIFAPLIFNDNSLHDYKITSIHCIDNTYYVYLSKTTYNNVNGKNIPEGYIQTETWDLLVNWDYVCMTSTDFKTWTKHVCSYSLDDRNGFLTGYYNTAKNYINGTVTKANLIYPELYGKIYKVNNYFIMPTSSKGTFNNDTCSSVILYSTDGFNWTYVHIYDFRPYNSFDPNTKQIVKQSTSLLVLCKNNNNNTITYFNLYSYLLNKSSSQAYTSNLSTTSGLSSVTDVYSIVLGPNNYFYISTNDGIYKSSSGWSWEKVLTHTSGRKGILFYVNNILFFLGYSKSYWYYSTNGIDFTQITGPFEATTNPDYRQYHSVTYYNGAYCFIKMQSNSSSQYMYITKNLSTFSNISITNSKNYMIIPNKYNLPIIICKDILYNTSFNLYNCPLYIPHDIFVINKCIKEELN